MGVSPMRLMAVPAMIRRREQEWVAHSASNPLLGPTWPTADDRL